MSKILVTGGAGYIGSHTLVELLTSGYDVVVVDNLDNSSEEAIRRAEEIAGSSISAFYETDLCDFSTLKKLFEKEGVFDLVIHFAGLKSVGESVSEPLKYYDNNLVSTLNLLKLMNEFDCHNFVFSSSATVYGATPVSPIIEDSPVSATNPYGQTKLMIEVMLQDISASNPKLNVIALRYFNPVGAHKSGMIGEDPSGVPNNLTPYISQVAVGKLESLSVFGGDYDTHDGTGVRDYIHVVDLAKAHVKAVEYISSSEIKGGFFTCNIGTGKGYSVLEVIASFEKVSGLTIPFKIVERRSGDVAECYANALLAKQVLGWQAEFELSDMMEDLWRWQCNNPHGYQS